MQNEFTIHEFGYALNVMWNSTGLKKLPTDQTYHHSKIVEISVSNIEAKCNVGGEWTISRSELLRVYGYVRDGVHNAAALEFTNGEDRVLAFAFMERISLPTCASGIVEEVAVKVAGLIAKKGVKSSHLSLGSKFFSA